MKNFLLIMFLFTLLPVSLFCQTESDTTSAVDDIKPQIPLTLKSINNYPDLLILNSAVNFSLPQYYSYQSSDLRSSLSLDMKKINTQLLSDFKQKMAWQKKQDLGVFGQYLGYAMSAAAAGLAISHIVKYKEQAFIGK